MWLPQFSDERGRRMSESDQASDRYQAAVLLLADLVARDAAIEAARLKAVATANQQAAEQRAFTYQGQNRSLPDVIAQLTDFCQRYAAANHHELFAGAASIEQHGLRMTLRLRQGSIVATNGESPDQLRRLATRIVNTLPLVIEQLRPWFRVRLEIDKAGIKARIDAGELKLAQLKQRGLSLQGRGEAMVLIEAMS